MKYFFGVHHPHEKALMQIIEMFDKEAQCTETSAEADIVIVPDEDAAVRLFNNTSTFLIVSEKRPNILLGTRVRWIKNSQFLVLFSEFFGIFSAECEAEANKPPKIVLSIANPARFPTDDTLNILVADDTHENLRKALDDLNYSHNVALAGSFREAMALMQKNRFDVVLTDLNMPAVMPIATSFSPDKVDWTTPVPIGIWLMFEATIRGSAVAIVTDADHHNDWASALIDQYFKLYKVNDCPVMFFNRIGKSWGTALAELQRMAKIAKKVR